MHLDTPSLQLVGNDTGGADFLEADLGMCVQVAPDGGEFVGVAVDAVDSGNVFFYPVAAEVEPG